MKKNLVTLSAIAFVLVACSGGGHSGGSSAPAQTPSPTPSSPIENKSGARDPISPSNSAQLEGAMVKGTRFDYEIKVVDSTKFLTLLKDSKKIVMKGQIYDSENVNGHGQRVVSGETFCLLVQQSGYPAESELKNKTLTFSSVELQETVNSGAVIITFNELEGGIGCFNIDKSHEFSWLEIQDAFGGIVEVKKAESESVIQEVSNKKVSDAGGYCTQEFLLEIRKMAAQGMDIGERSLELLSQLQSAKSSKEKQAYQAELQNQERKMKELCNKTESTWGNFSCKVRQQDGTEVQINSDKIYEACDQTRGYKRI